MHVALGFGPYILNQALTELCTMHTVNNNWPQGKHKHTLHEVENAEALFNVWTRNVPMLHSNP